MRTSLFNCRLSAFSRLELVATGACALLLLILVVAAAPRSRESGQRAVCANNLKRLGAAIQSYSSEHEGRFPPRNVFDRWPVRLQPYFSDPEVLICPADSPSIIQRSYLFNGFDDYWLRSTPNPFFTTNELGMPETAIPKPSQTLAFGEKIAQSFHYHVQIANIDHLLEIDHSRHFRNSPTSGERQASGSNYAFLDGSVRFLRFGEAISPINLWAVTDMERTNTVVQ
jgi:prepilin-type processing-associated H-X9-DG protein